LALVSHRGSADFSRVKRMFLAAFANPMFLPPFCPPSSSGAGFLFPAPNERSAFPDGVLES